MWAGYGVYSDVKASPDGRHILVASSFDDYVNVIDAETNEVVSILPVGDFPLQIAFNASGSHASVTNYYSQTVTTLRVAGAGSSVIGTYTYGQEYPMRLAHDPVSNRTAVGNYSSKNLTLIDPETGGYLSTQSYANLGNILQVRFDESGTPLVLTKAISPAGYLLHGSPGRRLHARPARGWTEGGREEACADRLIGRRGCAGRVEHVRLRRVELRGIGGSSTRGGESHRAVSAD